MNLRSQPVRLAAAVGAVVAAGTTTFLALAAGTASADEPGRCTQNVNVREEPDTNSRIVALCEAGTAVKLGAEQDGWVKIDELGGWASKDFVKADETSSRSSDDESSRDSDSRSGDAHDADDDRSSGHDADSISLSGSTDGDGDDSSGVTASHPGAQRGVLGGLLG